LKKKEINNSDLSFSSSIPAGVNMIPHPPEANLVKRFLAFQIDFIIILVATILLTFLIGIAFELSGYYRQRLFYFLLYIGFLLRDHILSGGSPGKRMMRLYVWVPASQSLAGFYHSVLRNLFIPFLFLDIWPLFFSEHQQRAGDFLAGTYVCDEEPRTNERRYIYIIAALTAFVLLLLFMIFTSWFASQTGRRTSLGQIMEAKESQPEDIRRLLEKNIQFANRFKVEKGNKKITITGEFPDPDTYYRGRRKVKELLDKTSYSIIAEEGPNVILRGPGEREFELRIEAKIIEGE
jgi:uncharacterized RDD family membrane protein YckC